MFAAVDNQAHRRRGRRARGHRHHAIALASPVHQRRRHVRDMEADGLTENYQTAYRCMAYATAILPVIAVVSIIPLGTVVRTAWGVWLVINASDTGCTA